MTPRWLAVPRQRLWRDPLHCGATVTGAAEEGYLGEFVSPEVYSLIFFGSWVNSV
jgi:hypothetical protein